MKYSIFVKVDNIDVMCFETEAESEAEAIEKCKTKHKITFYEKYKLLNNRKENI